jgi:DNA-binding protein Fis
MKLEHEVNKCLDTFMAFPLKLGDTLTLNNIKKLIEPVLYQNVLQFTKGNRVRAAQILGLNRSNVVKKFREYGLCEFAEKLRKDQKC